MKNIHILSTDKSRLYRNLLTDRLFILESSFMDVSECNREYQNIYITNSEEIKEGDWCFLDQPLEYGFPNYQEIFQNKEDSNYLNSINNLVKKIILTTDQDLIKDGVQAIDDEFLQWFVGVPFGEIKEVEVEFDYNSYKFGKLKSKCNKIIIPQEEIISWNELIKEAGSEEELIKILKLPHISPLVREAMRNNCKK
jgi:hypothetical protein